MINLNKAPEKVASLVIVCFIFACDENPGTNIQTFW